MFAGSHQYKFRNKSITNQPTSPYSQKETKSGILVSQHVLVRLGLKEKKKCYTLLGCRDDCMQQKIIII